MRMAVIVNVGFVGGKIEIHFRYIYHLNKQDYLINVLTLLDVNSYFTLFTFIEVL